MMAWRGAGKRGSAEHSLWQKRHDAAERCAEFDRRVAGDAPAGMAAAVTRALADFANDPEEIPIRQGSQKAVGVLAKLMPELVGGSADLTNSVLTGPPKCRRSISPVSRAATSPMGFASMEWRRQ